MRKKQLLKKGIVCAAVALGLAIAPGIHRDSSTGLISASAETETAADSSAEGDTGISYIVNSGSTAGINLNGNSVVIVSAEAPEDASSSSSVSYISIYNDANKNGVIDEGETPFVLGDSEVIAYPGMPVYGAYNTADVTKDISITVDGVILGSLYGIYGGTSTGSVNIAVKNGANISGALYGVQNASIDGSFDLEISGDSTANVVYGLYSAQVKGSVTIKTDEATISSVLYGEASGCDTGKDLTMDIKNTAVGGYIYAAGDYSGSSHVGGSLSVSADKDSSYSGINGAYYTTVGGDITVNADNDGSKVASVYAFNSSSSQYSNKVGGNIELNITGGKYSTIEGAMGYRATSDGSTSYKNLVSGSVKVNISNASASSYVYAVNEMMVEGDVSLISTESSAPQCESDVYVSYNSLINGNVKVDFYNNNTGNYSNFRGVYTSDVGKNVDINVSGGSYSYVNGAYGSYSYVNGAYTPQCNIKGKFNFSADNLKCTSYFYPLYSYNVGGNATIKVDTINNPNKYSLYVYGMDSSVVNGKADIYISNLEYAYTVYGINSSSILGGTEAEEDGYINHVSISDSTCYSTVRGINETSVEKSANVKITNITGTSGSSVGLYGVYEGSNTYAKGDVSVELESCTVNNLYAYTGSSYTNAESHTGDVSVTISKCIATYNMYGINYGTFNGNVTVNSSYNIAQYKYMTSYITSTKSLVVNSSYENSPEIKDAEGNSLIDNYTYTYGAQYYVTSGGHLEGTVSATISNLNASYFFGVGANEMGAEVSMTLKDSTLARSTTDTSSSTITTYLYYPSSTVSGKTPTANITLDNVDFSGYTNGIITNQISADSDVYITINDNCTFADDTVILPISGDYLTGKSEGMVVITSGKDVYLGGDFTLDKDLTAENIYVGNYNEYVSGTTTYSNTGAAFVTIPEGVTLKATGNIYLPVSSSILNMGTISGNITSTVNTNDYNNGKVYGSIYVNGGTISGKTNDIKLYYPIYVEYLEKGGTVTKSGISAITQDTENEYALAGETVSFTMTPNKGYYISGAKVKSGADALEESLSVDTENSTYSIYKFDMTGNNTYVNLLFAGKQIVLGKTVADPVAILNQKTTADEPLYDMADVTITNDGKEGTVTYEVDETYGLPQGLEFAEGKIYGTPTVAYDEGKKVVIHVTGRNDTKADLTLNIIVSKEAVEQTSQDGRITVDEENKSIILNGCSVVIEETEDGSAIYIDDNKDGKADKTTALFSGDLSDFTITGITDTEVAKALKITMNSGNVGTIYGAVDSEMKVSAGDAVDIEILGGTVSKCYALNNTTVEGTIREIFKSENVSTKGLIAGSGSYTGAYYQYQSSGDVLYIYKNYTVDNDIDVTKLTVGDNTSKSVGVVTFNGDINVSGSFVVGNYSTAILNAKAECGSLSLTSSGYAYLTIAKDAQLTVSGNTTVGTSTDAVSHKGSFACAGTFKNSGKWYMAGGTFVEGTDASAYTNLYYPVGVSTDMESVTVDFYSYDTTTYDSARYAVKGGTVRVTYTAVDGYDVYLTVNDGEPELVTTTYATFTMPETETKAVMDYVPKQISLSRTYADPVAKVDTEYTAASPLYDLTTLTINDDTTSAYGSAVTYAIKKGSSLPAGLSLENGKIVGTPTKVDTEGTTVTFVVKGRNDTTAELEMNIVVQDTDYQDRDLTESVSVSSNVINLNGNSVVIRTSLTDSTKVSIYPDANHDGVADSSKALTINGADSYDLSSYTIYGYKPEKDSETGELPVYEGDISIYVKAGTISSLYGVYGTATANAVVDGKVTINISGGKISSNTVVAYYADVTESELILTGGTVGGNVYAGSYATARNVTFQATNKIIIPLSTNMYVTYNSTISGDVNAKVGTQGATSSYGFATSSSTRSVSYFYGVANSTVKGNVNCIIDGRWVPRKINHLVYDSSVAMDVNITWDGGYYGCSSSTGSLSNGFVCCNNGTNAESIGNINVTVTGKGTDSYSGSPYIIAGGVVGNVVYDGVAATTSITSYISSNSETTLNGALYANNKGAVTIGGTYTIDKDIEATTFTIEDGADVTIAEGVTVTASNAVTISGTLTNKGTLNTTTTAEVSGTLINDGTLTTDRTNASSTSSSYYLVTVSGKLVNNGTWSEKNHVKVTGSVENNGNMYGSTSYTLTIGSGCFVTNNEGGNLVIGNITNSGTVVNYGELSQTYSSTAVGTIYTTTKPTMYKALTYYSTIYYAVALDYPEYCFEDSDTAPVSFTSTNLKASGIEGDTNQYIAGGKTLGVKVAGTFKGSQVVDSVVFGNDGTTATSSDDITWSAATLYEPFTATVNVVDNTAQQIELDKTKDSVDSAVVGVTTTADKPLYDMTAIAITNDTEIENGYVTYVLKSGNSLPAGLVLKNGKIYGTPTTASDTEQQVTLVIRGINQTTAEFVLTFSKVAKGTPTLTLPTAMTTAVGTRLSEVSIPDNSKGTLEWVDGDTVVAAASADGDLYDAWFTPADTDNYDWSLLDKTLGIYQADEGKVKVSLTVKTYKSTPKYTVPTDITATYGDTLADVALPEAENGKFEWMDTSLSVGNAGTGKFKAKFVPNDTTAYNTVSDITVTITINPKKAEYTQETIEFKAHEGTALSDLELPEAENGKYQWITSSSTVVLAGKTYKLGYKPDDTDNYDWSGITGWSKSYKCVVIEVTVDVVAGENHNFGETYKYDETNHWLECSCGEKSEVTEHTWNEGEVTKKATATETGVMTYTCSACNATKNEVIPVDTSQGEDKKEDSSKPDDKKEDSSKPDDKTNDAAHTHSYSASWSKDATYHWRKCACGEVTGKANHTWDAGKVTKTATMLAKGEKTYTCKVCGATKKVATSKVSVVKGKTYTVSKMKYKVTKVATNGTGTVTLVGSTNSKTAKKFTTLKVGSTVTIAGVKFKITAIGSKAFKGYNKLKTVTIGANVTTIGKNAFYGCTKLSKLTLGKNVTTIGASAFYKCTALKSVVIPAKVKSIGANAFAGCKNLATVTIKTKKLTAKKVGSNAFKGIKSKAVIKITKTKYVAYKKFLSKKGPGKKVTYKKI
jgi:sorbitol-specific phosphotransferase system component IIA